MIRTQTTITGSVIYSHFRHLCPYHTWLLFNVGVTEVTPAPSDRLLMDTGIRHEDEALKYFKDQLGDECVEIPAVEGRNREDDMALRAEKTVLAMEEGKQVIYHGILAPDMRLLEKTLGPLPFNIPMRGETDFLFRVDYLNQRMVDLYKLIRNTYFLPVRSYSIKEVAPCIKRLMEKRGLEGGHQWKKIQSLDELETELKKSRWSTAEIRESLNDVREVMKDFKLAGPAMMFDPSADMSVVWYNLYVERKKRVWMKLIEIYNEDDLNATRALVDWFLFMETQTKGSKPDA